MLQIINAKLDNDFDNPLGLLSDCHRRIEKFLEQLLRVTQTTYGGVLDEGQREALTIALRYFRKAAPLHTEDEEVSLFPRLHEKARNGNAKAQQALAIMEKLEADHDRAGTRHATIDEMGVRWLNQNTLSKAETQQLETELRELRTLYAAHIAIEDQKLFHLAGEVLSEDEVEKIGREMAARRGLDFDNLPAGSRCAARKVT